MLEQRKHTRSIKETYVRLYKNESLQALARTENLTSSGMFIHTDSLLYPQNSILNIVFDEPETKKQYCVDAKVIHRSLGGIGVQFQDIATIDSSKDGLQLAM